MYSNKFFITQVSATDCRNNSRPIITYINGSAVCGVEPIVPGFCPDGIPARLKFPCPRFSAFAGLAEDQIVALTSRIGISMGISMGSETANQLRLVLKYQRLYTRSENIAIGFSVVIQHRTHDNTGIIMNSIHVLDCISRRWG